MYPLNEERLAHWLMIGNQPAGYMHRQWWAHLQIESLFALYTSGIALQMSINRQIINILKLPALLPGQQAYSEQQFWIEHFFALKPLAPLVGVLLLENPKTAFMQGPVYRQLTEGISAKKVRVVLMNERFVVGELKASLRSVPSLSESENLSGSEQAMMIEKKGVAFLVASVCPALKSRVRLLFHPDFTGDDTITVDLTHKQKAQVQKLVQRLIHLCGVSSLDNNCSDNGLPENEVKETEVVV